MTRKSAAVAAVALLLSIPAFLAAEETRKPKEWPEVLVIDDFEDGLEKWENQDAGKLELVEGAPSGKKALRWTASDDGIGHVVLRNLNRETIDFSQYDLLTFWVKFEGKPIWNLNPIVQQYPAVYGFRGLYYSVDTMDQFGEWFVYTQDLRRWENAWPDTFSAEKQEFQFEVAQLAGPEYTRVCLDDIKLLKNSLGLEKSYPGRWARLTDGSQVTHFRVRLENRGPRPLSVRAKLVQGSLNRLQGILPDAPLSLLPGETGEAFVRVFASPEVVAVAPPYYGETAKVAFTVYEAPGLVLFTELSAGIKPEKVAHPAILMNPARMTELRAKWNKPELQTSLSRDFQVFVGAGESALAHVPEYPPMAVTGRSACVLDGVGLATIPVPNLPFATYQCPKCGLSYSGPLYDAGMQNWAGKHQANAAAARNLGFAYGITGRKEFAVAAAAILRGYIERYEKLPVAAPGPGSPVHSHTSGASRIGSSYMNERNWLTAMAIALDFIQPAGVLSQDELVATSEKVFAPSAHLMMDHKVGAMNLQWMIASSALYAGLAAENPGLVARAMYDPHGVINLIRVGYLPDGNWWENPSYQNVANGVAFPTLATCIYNGLLPWEDKLAVIFKAAYKLYGPDGRSPTLGTGGPGGYSYSDNAIHSLAAFTDDPELAWIAHHRPLGVAWSGEGQPYESYLWALTWQGTPKVPKGKTVSPIPDRTTVFPDYGGIALRVPGAGNYCYMHFGRELVHGHRNKLSINAYAKGAWFVRNVVGGYGDNFKNFLETIASSTSIMVDGENPDADTGELLFHKSGEGWEAASAREVGAYKSLEHERTVVLTRGPLIVIDRCVSVTEHTFDWLYQSSLTGLALDVTSLEKTEAQRLGESVLYQSLVPSGRFDTVGLARLARSDGSGLSMAFLNRGELLAFKALSKTDGLLWRQKGKVAGFAAVYGPYGKGETGEVSIESLQVNDANGQVVGLDQGQAVSVRSPEGVFTVLLNYRDRPISCRGLWSEEHVAVAIHQ
ncbi:MAG: hypothetical protein HYU36_23550 [Planctomycetes bacterium]|nr:hypothetical protein [Planctomycetota bacterium]